jgi:molybdopterin molybdotransferase
MPAHSRTGMGPFMLTVAAAQEVVSRHARPLPAVRMPLAPQAYGLVLAEDIQSDLDLPPYDKALMDGYAVRVADLASGQATLAVVEEVSAGRMPSRAVPPGGATRIMTGAPLPEGADAVVMVERTQLVEAQRVRIEDQPPRVGQNILRRGREMRRGDRVLAAGVALRPQEMGLLASVGRALVAVYPRPEVAVLPTGDELVDVGASPGPGQIRNSNGPMLASQALRAGGVPRTLGIARDTADDLRARIETGLEAPVLVLAGGVSAGKRDLVPAILEELGVEPHFHKVEMKPGKPVFFGTRGGTLVFGLPGNPVSALVCFELFVRPAIRRLAGHADVGPTMVDAVLGEDYAYRTDRPTYHPAGLSCGVSGWEVRAVPWFGSSDLRGLGAANAFVLFPPGDHLHRAGQRLAVLKVED